MGKFEKAIRKFERETEERILSYPSRERLQHRWAVDLDGCYFDPRHAARIVDFAERYCIQTTGEISTFKLRPPQRSILEDLIGWRRASGHLRWKEGCIFAPRRFGKSYLIAILILYFACGMGENAGEIIACASSLQTQSRAVWKEVKAIIEGGPLRDHFQIRGGDNKPQAVHIASNTKIHIMGDAPKSSAGGTPNLVIVDEISSFKSRDVYDKIKKASAGRKDAINPFSISTASVIQPDSLATSVYERCKSIIYAEDTPEDLDARDSAYYGKLYELLPEHDPDDERNWIIANPRLSNPDDLDEFRRQYKAARKYPTEWAEFLRDNLGVWTTSTDGWLKNREWEFLPQLVEGEPDPTAAVPKLNLPPEGELKWYAGFDGSRNKDLTSAAFLGWHESTDRFFVKAFNWISKPHAFQEGKRCRIPYESWLGAGWLKTTGDGATIDKMAVADEIIGFHKSHPIELLCADQVQGEIVLAQAEEHTYVSAIQQKPERMNQPLRYLEYLIFEGKLIHEHSPVCAWCVNNARIFTNHMGLSKVEHSKNHLKSDFCVALVMSVAAFIENNRDIDFGVH